MIGLYVIVTAMIFFMAGIVVGWCLHAAHLKLIKDVVTAITEATPDKEQGTP